jgi:N-acetyltransferase 10
MLTYAGVAMAGAVAMGYSNIFVTAPSPENLNTLFEFVFKGLDAMDYKVRVQIELLSRAQHRDTAHPDQNASLCRDGRSEGNGSTPTSNRHEPSRTLAVTLPRQEHIDYDLVESTNPAFGKAIVRVNIFRNHRQTIQYIQPQHHERCHQAELLVIDEAAAIPLPIVKNLLGPYLVFLCSTVNGCDAWGCLGGVACVPPRPQLALTAWVCDGLCWWRG